DEDVEPAERLDRLRDEPLGHLRVAEVAGNPVDGAELVEPLLRLLVLGPGVLGRVPEREAVAEQPLGDRIADPAVRAGDEGDTSHGRRMVRTSRFGAPPVQKLVISSTRTASAP